MEGSQQVHIYTYNNMKNNSKAKGKIGKKQKKKSKFGKISHGKRFHHIYAFSRFNKSSAKLNRK